MKARPILFSGPMVRALLDGRKTQTRRIMKPQPSWVDRAVMKWKNMIGMTHSHKCPYGAPGDLLYVRETWAETDGRYERHCPVAYRATDDGRALLDDRWRPSIYMPRWASRLTLEITDVRVERLTDISGRDAVAEGARSRFPVNGIAQAEFLDLWDSIHGPGARYDNPFLWVIEFSVQQCNVDVLIAQRVAA